MLGRKEEVHRIPPLPLPPIISELPTSVSATKLARSVSHKRTVRKPANNTWRRHRHYIQNSPFSENCGREREVGGLGVRGKKIPQVDM